jgi:hypothetical protein
MKSEEELSGKTNFAREFNNELHKLYSELKTHGELMEFYDNATVIGTIISILIAVIWGKYYLSIALTPIIIYSFLKFLKHRKLKKVLAYQIYIVKHLYKRQYGL